VTLVLRQEFDRIDEAYFAEKQVQGGAAPSASP
jgi:hypothetical protein